MSFRATKEYFQKNGKPYFLISGEIHYFRLDPKLWEKHLKLLKESGANTTSTYIPWDWHEFEEGKFDFTGETNPARNLIHYILLCKKIGLDLIVKPGPYILAEYEGEGLPSWFIKKAKKNTHALNEKGGIIADYLMSYLSEEYLNYTFLWYNKIMPIIAEHQESNNGPIIMLQVCNEIGIFQWLTGEIDYNPIVLKQFNEFLTDKYRDIHSLNNTYKSNYSSFNEVEAPKGIIKNKQDYCLYFDFHLFYRKYFLLYLNTLIDKIKSFGIDLQLSHNIPGWIYGNSAELPMLISTYSEIMKSNNVVFGLDHIPEFFSFRNAHSDLACNKILEAMQNSGPVWAAEFQCGTREHQVKSDPNDLEAFYFASLAHGLKGFNYYMFSQGINPKGKGFAGKTFYFQTALDATAKKSALYDSVKKVNRFILTEELNLLQSSAESDICVGLYKPYFYTELTTSQLLKEKKLYVQNLGLQFDPRFIREEILFNGLLRIFQSLNYNYDIKDLEATSFEELLRYKQLWIVATEFMDEITQQNLLNFVQAGGHLIIYPTIPTLDLYLNDCTILKDGLKIKFSKSLSPNKVNVLGIDDVYTVFKEKIIFDEPNRNSIAYTNHQECCGIRKKVADGFVTVLGLTFGYTSDEHLHLIESLLQLNNIKHKLKVDEPELQFVLRKSKKNDYIFLLNYHNQKKIVKVKSKQFQIKPFSYKVIKMR